MRAPIASICALACFNVTPGLSLAKRAEPVEVAGHVLRLERQWPPDLREGPVERAARRQHADHRVGTPSSVMERPTTSGSAPNREFQKAWLRTATRSLPELVLLGGECPAECGLDAENIEIMRRHPRPA